VVPLLTGGREPMALIPVPPGTPGASPPLLPGEMPAREPPVKPKAPAPTTKKAGEGDGIAARVEAVLSRMTLEEKVGQLMFVGFGGYHVDPGGPIERLVRGHHVGGVALFSRNVHSVRQVARFTRQLAALEPKVPPFIAVDQEGGIVVRLHTPVTVLPGNMTLGAAHDLALTRRAAADQARDLRLVGFNMNLAPVLDVNVNPDNPVIGVRSFGEDPHLVARQGAAYVRGLASQGIVAVAKHFPGHGDTSRDSHYDLPSVPYGMKRLMSVELVPFKAAIDAGLDVVMTAHIALPKVEGRPHVPATVSHKVLTGILRDRLGFKGIILTDGLEMKGIVDAYGCGPAAVKAIQAGADMVLILWSPEKKEEVWRHLLAAVLDGRISMTRLDTSVRRILTVKMRRGLFDHHPPPVAEALHRIGHGWRGRSIAQEIADRGLTLVRGAPGLTPLDARSHPHIVVLSASRTFTYVFHHHFKGARVVQTPPIPSRERWARDTRRAVELGRHADVVVVAVVNDYQAIMAKVLVKRLETPVVVVSLGSPYFLRQFPHAAAYLCTYSYEVTAARAAANYLDGDGEAPGRLPVTLPGLYPIGHTALARRHRRTGALGADRSADLH